MKILLIPWFKASSKNLNKYILSYNKLGVVNIDIFNYDLNCITPFNSFHNIYNENRHTPMKYDLVHSFSGGSLIQQNLHMANWKFNKIVYDSGPMFITPTCVTNYLIETGSAPKPFRKRLHKGLTFLWNIDSMNNDVENYKQLIFKPHWKNNIFPKDTPSLLFNSKIDNIILLDEIIKYKNDNSKLILYDNSPHVQHIRYYRENYLQNLYEFIQM